MMRLQTRRCRKHSSACLPKHFFVWMGARSEENARRSTGVCVYVCVLFFFVVFFFSSACQCVPVFMCVCFLLAGLECFCCFSLAGCSDWLALGRGDIMFSPKPTCIPHPPSTAATIVSECVCVCVCVCVCRLLRVCASKKARGRVSEGGLCVQAITHSALSAKVLLVSLAKADEV